MRVQDLCDVSAEVFGSVRAHDKATLETENQHFGVQLQDRTTLFFLTLLELALKVALVLTRWASTLSALRLAVELLHVRPRLNKASRIQTTRGHNGASIFALSFVRK